MIDVSSTIESDGRLQCNLSFDIVCINGRLIFFESSVLIVRGLTDACQIRNSSHKFDDAWYNATIPINAWSFQGGWSTFMISPLIAGSNAP